MRSRGAGPAPARPGQAWPLNQLRGCNSSGAAASTPPPLLLLRVPARRHRRTAYATIELGRTSLHEERKGTVAPDEFATRSLRRPAALGNGGSSGWDWRKSRGRHAPLLAPWAARMGAAQRRYLGGTQPNRPACHVCFYEADAYCHWAGRRWRPRRSGRRHQSVSQTPAAESTASTLGPYPNLEQDAYPDNSWPWLGSQKVLRGGRGPPAPSSCDPLCATTSHLTEGMCSQGLALLQTADAHMHRHTDPTWPAAGQQRDRRALG